MLSVSSMFEPSMVVQSAASSFNNVALAAPSFFWLGLLMLPLFALVYYFGNDFMARIKMPDMANPKWRTFNYALVTNIAIFAWLILMPGNYSVLRDGVSGVSFITAAVLFILSASIIQKLRVINPPMPSCLRGMRYPGFMRFAFMLLVVGVAGLCGVPTVWGFALNASAVLCGAFAGRAFSRGVSPIFTTTTVVFAIITAILMQPEFFRFGQLGNLTPLHILFILVAGLLSMMIIVIRNIKPCGRIHQSAFAKLKWMARIVTALCLILFVLTESVPVFLGLMAVFFVSTSMSVWHARSIPENLSKKLWAVLLCVFGIMTVMPVITAIGILYWINLPRTDVYRHSKHLL